MHYYYFSIDCFYYISTPSWHYCCHNYSFPMRYIILISSTTYSFHCFIDVIISWFSFWFSSQKWYQARHFVNNLFTTSTRLTVCNIIFQSDFFYYISTPSCHISSWYYCPNNIFISLMSAFHDSSSWFFSKKPISGHFHFSSWSYC